MEIGARIEAARERIGWTQSKLARAIDLQPTRVSRWERDDGQPTLPQVVRIADALGVTLDYLLRGIEPEPTPELSRDEVLILDLARELGYPEAKRRLLALDPGVRVTIPGQPSAGERREPDRREA